MPNFYLLKNLKFSLKFDLNSEEVIDYIEKLPIYFNAYTNT